MFPSIDTVKTGRRIRYLMLKHEVTPKDIQKALCLGCVQSVYRWFSGQSLPTLDNLYALSKILGEPMESFLCPAYRTVHIQLTFRKPVHLVHYFGFYYLPGRSANAAS